MSPEVIPINHVLRIKREGGKIELELMRFLSLKDMRDRRPHKFQNHAWPKEAQG